MKNGREEFDQRLLDSLEKKHQLFLDSPNGEISVYLVLNKTEASGDEFRNTNSISAFNKNSSFQMTSTFNNSSSPGTNGGILQQNKNTKNLTGSSDINNFS